MKFLLVVLITAAVGVTAAWSINHNRFAYREAKFGPFDTAGEVTADDLDQYVNFRAENPDELGVVELLDEELHDFGVMAPDTKGEKSFRIRNVGQGPLRLRLGASTCKCTLGELDKEELAPGEQTVVTLSWTTKQGVRDFAQSAQVLTNDPSNTVIDMKIKGRVISDFEVVPETWAFNDIATGEPFQVSGAIYNYSDSLIEPGEITFSSKAMTELASFDIQPIPKEEFDEDRKSAVQGFSVTAKVEPGMQQGAISQNLNFFFSRDGDDASESSTAADGDDASDFEEGQTDDPGGQDVDSEQPKTGSPFIPIAIKGRIVGPIRMIESSKLKAMPGSGYHYKFGRLKKSDSLRAKTFVMLKGPDRETTKLSIGDITPDGMVKATFGEAKSRGSMVLYPLTIELIPGKEPKELLGKSSDDYARIWIESDNDQVSKMRILVSFSIPGM